MLTEGYLRGWLTFDNKTQLSALRESYLLSVLERRMITDFSRTKLGVMGSVVSGNLSRQSLTALTRDVSEHLELELPYLVEKTRIRSNTGGADINDPAFWRKALAARQEAIDKAVLPPEEPAPEEE